MLFLRRRFGQQLHTFGRRFRVLPVDETFKQHPVHEPIPAREHVIQSQRHPRLPLRFGKTEAVENDLVDPDQFDFLVEGQVGDDPSASARNRSRSLLSSATVEGMLR